MQLFSEQECRPRSGVEEAVLIGRILAGRKDLFDELLKPHLAPLWRVVQAKMGTDTDAEDVVQQTLLKPTCTWNNFGTRLDSVRG